MRDSSAWWLLALVSTGLAAQPAPNRIEEVVITPNRIPVPLRGIGTSIAVITQRDIEAHGNLGLTDILRQLPGVATSGNGGMGQPTSLRIRGEEGFRTLALIDGMRLSDPANTQINSQLEHLLGSGIERVEVLRGPQGLGYGADAGGVINVSTRRAGSGLQGGVEAQGGSYGTRQQSAFASGSNARADFFVAAADVATDGFNSLGADALLQDADGYDNTTLHARGGINLNQQWRADLVGRRVEGAAAFDGCYLPDFTMVHDCRSTYRQDAARAALGYQGATVTHSFSYAATDTRRDSVAQAGSSFVFAGELQRWEYLGSATALPGFDLVFGADHERAAMDTRERESSGYFAEVLSDFSEAWFFTAGVRYDDNDDFGSNTSYRMTTARLVELAGNGVVKFKASVGTGFRAPSPYEIAYNSGPWAYAPASLTDLQQERSRGVEAGVEYLGDEGLQLEAVYFDQNVNNVIDFDLNGYSGYLQDTGRSNSRGVELVAKLPVTAVLSLQANYTWNQTERPDGTQRLRRPRQLANAGLSWQPQPKLALHAFVRASRDAVDQDFSAVVPLDDFAVLDLSAAYAMSESLQLFGRIENALDEQYQEVLGYNTAGTAAYIGFRLNIGAR